MKVELQSGDTITIPEGCKAIVKDGSVVFEKEEREFKDGDIIAKGEAVAILKGGFNNGMFRDYVCINFDGKVLISNNTEWSTNPAGWHIATDEEKQTLFDKMKEQGLQWNEEEKRVEKMRWRAKKGENYFLLNRTDFEVDHYYECFDEVDAKLYKYGNYFRTREQAEEAARRMKETLRKYHEETGE